MPKYTNNPKISKNLQKFSIIYFTILIKSTIFLMVNLKRIFMNKLKRIVGFKPVEFFDYKNCISETNFFGFNLIQHGDISLSIRLIRELEEEHKKSRFSNETKNNGVDPYTTPIGLRE